MGPVQHAQQLAMRKILRPDRAQAKPGVSEPDRSYEHEADHATAPATVTVSEPSFSGVAPGALGGAPPIQRAENEESEEELQRQPDEEEEEPIQAKLIQRQSGDEEEEPVQAKLTIGQPNDKYEQEADHVADQVMAMPAASLQRQPENEEENETVQAKPLADQITPLVQRQEDSLEEEAPVQTRLIQRQAEEEEEQQVQPKLIQRQAEEEEPVQTRLIQRVANEEEEKVQPKLIQRQGEDEQEEQVQSELIQRQTEEEEDSEVQAKGAIPSAQAASQAVQNPSAGSPMRPDVRSILESGLGTDLSSVRVHEDGDAHEAAASINAKAFTHKNDIWLGEGQSQSDVHLMAHETTHVVQQGGGLRAKPKGISQTSGRVQRLWNPLTAVANVVGDAVDWVGDSIGDAVNYIKDKASEFVRTMPGYSLFTVVNGSDPITGQNVERNGRNFIEAGLDVIPNGDALKQKLEEEDALDEAAQWLDEQIAELDISPSEIGAQLSAFWSSLSLADATRLPTVMNRLLNIIQGPVERIIRFAVNVASRLLQIVKDYLVSSLINFIKEQTTGYPLLTVILGRDPVSGEAVERTPIALLRGFMLLSESGAEQLRQMEESGSLQKAADWLDGAIARLNLSWEELVAGFMSIWDSVGIRSLLDPVGVFRQIYETFAAPVGRIINFVIEVGTMILKFIKDALVRRLVAYARTIRGYPLLTVILGRDPFSDVPVERSAENIIHGFMSLMDGGEEQFQEMKQTGAIARLTTRIENAIATLNFTWEYIKGLFVRAWESFSLQDLAAPIAAFQRLMGIFGAPLLRLISFVGEVIKLVIEVALQLMNFPVALISNIITKAMQAFEDIKRDPIGFLKNLLRAVKSGFVKFFDNIATHLINGVTGWLFKELEDAGIRPPADLSLQSILGFVMDVLGVSVDRIFQKLAAKIGQDKVDRMRGMIDRLTGIWTFVSDVMTRGPVAIWEYIQEKISNLWNVVLDAVRNWVVTRIVQRVVAKLLSMLDPTGIMAVVNGFIAFYNAVQSFVAYLREMLEIVNSFVEGVAEIAGGSVERAANFLEGSLARAVPIAIGFLANQVGLSGIGRRIGEMIERVREMVDKGLDWLIDKAVSAGSALLRMGRNAVAAVRNWWTVSESAPTRDGKSHRIEFRGTGTSANLIIRSDPVSYSDYLGEVKTNNNLTDSQIKPALDKSREIDALKLQTVPDDKKEEHGQKINEAVKALARLTSELPLSAGQDNTETVYGPRYSGYGTMASVASMKKPRSGGSHADSSLFTDNYRILNTRMRGSKVLYARGHLLNADLGGPGSEWRNLTPLSVSGNKLHSTRFESKVKTEFDAGKNIRHFKVEPKYDRPMNPFIAELEDGNRKLGSGWPAMNMAARRTIANVMRAEVAVPSGLDCSAEVWSGAAKTKDIKPGLVENKIYETDKSTYSDIREE